jgi:hypothetical protein
MNVLTCLLTLFFFFFFFFLDHIGQLEKQLQQQSSNFERLTALGSSPSNDHALDHSNMDGSLENLSLDTTVCNSDRASGPGSANVNGHAVESLPVRDSNLLQDETCSSTSTSALRANNDLDHGKFGLNNPLKSQSSLCQSKKNHNGLAQNAQLWP